MAEPTTASAPATTAAEAATSAAPTQPVPTPAPQVLLPDALAQCETPYYLFDEAATVRRIEELRAALPAGTNLAYAMKANPFIVASAAEAAGLVEVCSPGELAICRAVGVPDERLVISGVYKDPELMRELVLGGASVHRYTAESPAQYELLAALAREAGTTIELLPRLTSGNQFGMGGHDLTDLIAKAERDPHVHVCGIQFFSGTQKRSASRVRRELAAVDERIGRLQEMLGHPLEELEYGPGIPFDYCETSEDQIRASDAAFLAGLAGGIRDLRFGGQVTLEIGRGIAACTGTYATRVVDTKRSRGNDYAIVDGGKHQLVYYGSSLALRPPVAHVIPAGLTGGAAAASAPDSAPTPDPEPRTYTVCGALCTAGDTLVSQLAVPSLEVGDLVVFPNAGAYCMTEGMSLFLSRDLPRVYLRTTTGELRLVRNRFETSALNTPAALAPGTAAQTSL